MLHAIERTVNVVNLIRLFRGDEIEIVIQWLKFNGLESGTHILLIDTYYEGRVLLTK